MTWGTTIDHEGNEVFIDSVEAMNAVIARYEKAMDALPALLRDPDRDVRARAAATLQLLQLRRARIDQDAEAIEEALEQQRHEELARAIEARHDQ